jgi:hypothetical protein
LAKPYLFYLFTLDLRCYESIIFKPASGSEKNRCFSYVLYLSEVTTEPPESRKGAKMSNRTIREELIGTAKLLLILAQQLEREDRRIEALLLYRKAAINGLLIRDLREAESNN